MDTESNPTVPFPLHLVNNKQESFPPLLSDNKSFEPSRVLDCPRTALRHSFVEPLSRWFFTVCSSCPGEIQETLPECSTLPIHCPSHDTVYPWSKQAGMFPTGGQLMLQSQKCAPASFKLHINKKQGRAAVTHEWAVE